MTEAKLTAILHAHHRLGEVAIDFERNKGPAKQFVLRHEADSSQKGTKRYVSAILLAGVGSPIR
jgi:hypothetical protein